MCVAKQVFREAVKAVLDDETIKLPSVEAKLALQTAMNVMKWIDDAQPNNEAIYETFINQLFLSLLTCFSSELSMKSQKEHMWKACHQLRISLNFRTT